MARSFRFAFAAVAALAVALPFVQDARAVGTRRFTLRSAEDFAGGELRGVSVDSQGFVRPGFNLGDTTLSGVTSVWSSLVLGDGSVLLGTSSNGKVMKVAGGQVSEYADTKQIAVTSLVQGPGGAVFAATMPAGKIFKLDAPGKMTELPAIADVESVWQLAYDAKKNTMYAATGPNGKLFSVSATGQAQVVFDSDEPNLVSVAVADDGTVYTGSSGKAQIFKVTGPGRASILLDCPGDEVKALSISKSGVIWAIANEFAEGGGGGGPARRPGGGAFGSAGPSAAGAGRPGKGTLFKIESDGKSEKMLSSGDSHYVSLALDDSGRPYVGTGAEGRVWTVDDNHLSTMLADTEERQVGSLVVSGKTRFIATSDPAKFHEIKGTGGTDATWTSKVLDAGLRATYGRLSWRSDGEVEMSTRSGNSAIPDATWSDWAAPVTAPGKTATTPGRYVQIRGRFAKDPKAALENVELAFITDNVRAVITHVDAKPRGTPEGSGLLPSSGSDVPPRSSIVKLSWRVENPDNDQLRYRVQFRFDGPNSTWRDMLKPDEVLTRTELEWDTASLPEGTYRVRVEASDENANAPGLGTKHSLESAPITVDNTAPVFKSITPTGSKLKATIVDGVGPIVRIDFSVDGKTEFRPLQPKDLVLDEAEEELDLDFATVLGAGNHLITLRAFDQAGNFVVRSFEIKK